MKLLLFKCYSGSFSHFPLRLVYYTVSPFMSHQFSATVSHIKGTEFKHLTYIMIFFETFIIITWLHQNRKQGQNHKHLNHLHNFKIHILISCPFKCTIWAYRCRLLGHNIRSFYPGVYSCGILSVCNHNEQQMTLNPGGFRTSWQKTSVSEAHDMLSDSNQ